MAITIKTKEEIDIIRQGGKRLAAVLREVAAMARPGISTGELDKVAQDLIVKSGGVPSFKEYRIKGIRKPYPATMCISVNEEVVHGIPRADRILKEGDIVGLDIGMWWPASVPAVNGRPAGSLCTDMAITVGVGKISDEARRLMNATKESLDTGIAQVKPGATVGDVGNAIEQYLKARKLGIIRDLAGHGVGYELHEDPLIPNYGSPGTGAELKEGMVIAIEPMATLGDWRVVLADDQWTFKTLDNSLGAHFEHTMAVTKEGVEVLTI